MIIVLFKKSRTVLYLHMCQTFPPVSNTTSCLYCYILYYSFRIFFWIEFSNSYYFNILDVPRKEVVGYYQWIPLVLLLQTLCFYTPSIIWSTHNSTIGMDINRMVLLVSGVEHINPDIRDKTIKFICRHFDRALAYQREYRRGRIRRWLQTLSRYCCCPVGKLYGNYLITLNLFVKLLYILNALGQLWLLNVFISNDKHSYTLYGVNVILDIWYKAQPNSRMFPRVTLCDFQVRQMQNVHDYTVQCTLPINLFNEKIYIFLWFWILFVAWITIVGFVYMIWTLFSMNRVSYLRKYLRIMNKVKKDNYADERLVRQFVNEYLRQDGVFALRLMAKNTNDVVTAEVIGALYEYFKKHYKPAKATMAKDGDMKANGSIGSMHGAYNASAPPGDHV